MSEVAEIVCVCICLYIYSYLLVCLSLLTKIMRSKAEKQSAALGKSVY